MNNFTNNFNIEKASQNHYYISQKMILDSINSIHIAKDHNNVSKVRNSFFTRSLDNLTGTSKKRQDFINENFISSLDGAINWLKDHDSNLSRVNQKIKTVANKILEIQNESDRFYIDYKALKKQVSQINEIMEFKFKDFEDRVKKLEAKDKIKTEISYLKSGKKYKNYSIPLKIYSLVDNLFSGEFGLIYYKKQDDEMIEFLESEIINYLNDQNLAQIELDFMQILQVPDENSKKALEFISASHYNNLVIYNEPKSISNLINNLTSKEPKSKSDLNIILNEKENSDISRFITYEKFTEKSIKEIKRSINQGDFL